MTKEASVSAECVCVFGGEGYVGGYMSALCELNMDESLPGLVFRVDDSALLPAF